MIIITDNNFYLNLFINHSIRLYCWFEKLKLNTQNMFFYARGKPTKSFGYLLLILSVAGDVVNSLYKARLFSRRPYNEIILLHLIYNHVISQN